MRAQSAKDIDGEERALSVYRGNVTLVVNVASACGYTDDNYKGEGLGFGFGFTAGTEGARAGSIADEETHLGAPQGRQQVACSVLLQFSPG